LGGGTFRVRRGRLTFVSFCQKLFLVACGYLGITVRFDGH